MFTRIVLSIIVVLMVFLAAGEASALTIGPNRFEVSLPPGEVAVADYYVQNETESPVRVVVEPENWAQDSYTNANIPIGDWIKLDTYEFELNPKEIKKLKLTIRVPKNIKGELMAQIFFTSVVTAPDEKTGGVNARLGAALYVAIKGTEKAQASIEDVQVFGADKAKNELDVGLTVSNAGNVHIRPLKGEIVIKDARAKELARTVIATDTSVLPGKKNIYHGKLNMAALSQGKYKISAGFVYGKMFGKEKAAKIEKALVVDKDGECVIK